VRPPRDTVESVFSRAEAHCAIKKLEQKPNAQEQDGRKNKCGAKEERWYERFDAGKRIKAEVSTHYCRDRSAGANRWHKGIGIGKDMQQGGGDASRQVQHYVSRATETVLDVVSENPQNPHVAEEMEPAAVKKHGAEEREDFLRGRIEMADLRIGVNCRDNCETPEQIFEM